MSTVALASCDCGWSLSTSSSARAERALGRHSCARHRAKAAAALRRVRRRALIDRTPQPCRHKLAVHQHGTHACYVLDHCRCRPCARANSDYESARVRRNAYGRSDLVDATPAREHVRALMAAGVGLKRIVVVSGVAQGVLWKLVYGKPRPGGARVVTVRVRTATATVLLALRAGDRSLLADGAVDTAPVGASRRLQALVCRGWSIARIGEEGNLNRQRLDRALAGEAITMQTTRAVAEVYDRLWDQVPPQISAAERASVSRSIRWATELGWAPPMAWDDDTIDDPDARPQHQLPSVMAAELEEATRGDLAGVDLAGVDLAGIAVAGAEGDDVDEAAVERRAGGERVPLTRHERWAVVRRLHQQGMNDLQIAARAGLGERQVLRDRQQLRLPAVTAGPARVGAVAS